MARAAAALAALEAGSPGPGDPRGRHGPQHGCPAGRGRAADARGPHRLRRPVADVAGGGARGDDRGGRVPRPGPAAPAGARGRARVPRPPAADRARSWRRSGRWSWRARRPSRSAATSRRRWSRTTVRRGDAGRGVGRARGGGRRCRSPLATEGCARPPAGLPPVAAVPHEPRPSRRSSSGMRGRASVSTCPRRAPRCRAPPTGRPADAAMVITGEGPVGRWGEARLVDTVLDTADEPRPSTSASTCSPRRPRRSSHPSTAGSGTRPTASSSRRARSTSGSTGWTPRSRSAPTWWPGRRLGRVRRDWPRRAAAARPRPAASRSPASTPLAAPLPSLADAWLGALPGPVAVRSGCRRAGRRAPAPRRRRRLLARRDARPRRGPGPLLR